MPLGDWVSLHPAALAHTGGPWQAPADGARRPRAAALAAALAAANERWGNPVAAELERWRDGAEVVITGQQPGLLGGPLLTLVKTCAVVAEVHRRRAAGRDAVAFLWLATADDDLGEMGWARLAVGEEVLEAREPAWARGGGTAGAAVLGADLRRAARAARRSRRLAARPRGCGVRRRVLRARASTLGEATARFLARLLRGAGRGDRRRARAGAGARRRRHRRRRCCAACRTANAALAAGAACDARPAAGARR